MVDSYVVDDGKTFQPGPADVMLNAAVLKVDLLTPAFPSASLSCS